MEDTTGALLGRAREWLDVAERAYEEYHFEQAGSAAALAAAHAQLALALNATNDA